MLLTHILHPIPYLFNNSQTVAFSGLSNLWNVTYISQTHHSCYPTDDMCLFRPFACWARGGRKGRGSTLQRLSIDIGELIADKTKVHFRYIHLNMPQYVTFVSFCYRLGFRVITLKLQIYIYYGFDSDRGPFCVEWIWVLGFCSTLWKHSLDWWLVQAELTVSWRQAWVDFQRRRGLY